MITTPTIEELSDLHKRVTYHTIQAYLQGAMIGYGCWLYAKDGQPGTLPLPEADLRPVYVDREDTPEALVEALATLARSYLVAGGAARTDLAQRGQPLPRALVLVVVPETRVDGALVKTFALTEHQTFLAMSPVAEGGKAVQLGALKQFDVSLTHNQRPGQLH